MSISLNLSSRQYLTDLGRYVFKSVHLTARSACKTYINYLVSYPNKKHIYLFRVQSTIYSTYIKQVYKYIYVYHPATPIPFSSHATTSIMHIKILGTFVLHYTTRYISSSDNEPFPVVSFSVCNHPVSRSSPIHLNLDIDEYRRDPITQDITNQNFVFIIQPFSSTCHSHSG